jgi:hypothetical protein
MKSAVESTGIDYITMCQRRPFYGGAMLDGIDAATGSHLLTMDGGMSTDPAKSPEMIVLAKQYPTHVIKGSRFKKGGSFGKYYPLPKLLWNVLSQLAVSVFYLTAFKDWTYAYLLAPTVYFQSVNWVELKHPLNLEFTLKFEKLGIHIREIAVKQAGGTASGYAETAGYLNPMLKVRFMKKSEILKPGVTLNL